jgi:hypothetical protein
MSKVKLIVGKVEHNPYKETNVVEVEEKEFQIDGYYVADRILEGVLFNIKFDENGEILNVQVDKGSESYFENLNKEKFLEMIENRAKDILSEGDEVDLPYHLKKKYMVNGRNFSAIDILS